MTDEEEKSNLVIMSKDQFTSLLQTITETHNCNMNTRSFAQCTSRYGGERDHYKVQEFITNVNIYKKVENISDDDALEGLPLLLTGVAATWWDGVKNDLKKWNHALEAIKSAFAPKRQPHEIYMSLFGKKQTTELIDSFICDKRALLAQLPPKRHKEEEQLDLVYGLLHIKYRKHVPRSDIKTFSELLEKCRHLESLEKERGVPVTHQPIKRCSFCGKKGHLFEECYKKIANDKDKQTISCYGCGTPGVFRSNCNTCKNKETPPKPVAFYTMQTSRLQNSAKIPTIEISVKGETGYAYIDTAARTSIAGTKLYHTLKRLGTKFEQRQADVILADGAIKQTSLLSATVDIIMGQRILPTTFSVMPDANDNRTLLGIDFLEASGIILNLPQRVWYFIDNPKETFNFLQLNNEPVPIKVVKSLSFDENKDKKESAEPLASFLKWANDLEMISPMSETPSPCQNPAEDAPPNKKPRWVLHKLDTPPRPVRPREPADHDSCIDPRISYVPINPIKLYCVDIYLRSNEGTLFTEDERIQFNELLSEYKDIFQRNTHPTPFAEHKIETGSHPPISVKPYRLSPARQQQLREKLDEMIENDIIEECDSPWSAPVILVPKGDNDVRVCVDYRRLNEITKPDRYPLPRIDDLLHQAKAMPYMSTIDLQSGYWQILVQLKDQDKTSFVSPFGTFRFKRMPFGLRNAPATFQRLMDKFIQGLKAKSVLSYLDDLICRSFSFCAHIEDIREVFEKLRKFNLRANRQKCNFGCPEVKYLGHLIVPEGIKTNQEKISAIANLPEPKNLKQLISFLQTASWYRRFIHKFAEIARPLTNLTKKKVGWQWNQEQRDAFNQLKSALTTAPVLKQADSDLPFTIKTDASQYAIGAALVQGEGEQEHPVEYASRLLTSAECNYTVTEKEALAIVWAINRFRGYIEGTKFITITDHQPLKWLMDLKTPTGRLARWALQLQPYDFKIQYTPGRTNVVADTLSRPPCSDHNEDCTICLTELELPKLSEKQIRDEQVKDEHLKTIIDTLEKGNECEDYVEWVKKGYLLHKGVLYRYIPEQDDDNAKLLIPRHEIPNILKAYHDAPTAGHMGVNRTLQRIANKFYWKDLRKDIIKYIKSCTDCQKYKPTNQKPAGLYQSTPNYQRFEVLSVDLFGPLPKGPSGEKWIFIVEDTASRWVELFAIPEATAEKCATILINEIFLRYGLPRKIISDNGVQFISAIMQKLTFCLEIEQIYTPVYHPEPNIVERKNRDMKSQIAIIVKDKHQNWPSTLPAIRFAMNTAKCQTTEFSPAYLTFGRELRTTYDLKHDLSSVITSENFVKEITPTLKQLAQDLALAKENIEHNLDTNRQRANVKRRPDPGYKKGDLVLVESHTLSNVDKQFASKLAPRRDGPYIILRKLGNSTYEIAHTDEPNKSIGKYHTSAITKFEMRDNNLPKPINPIRQRGRPRKTTGAGTPVGTTSDYQRGRL